MAVWLEERPGADLAPLKVRTLALVPGPDTRRQALAPFVQPDIPAVDGILPGRRTLPDLLRGGGQEAGAAYDHLLWLGQGETLLIGNPGATLRHAAQQVTRSCLLPVHYGVAHDLTLLALEPRWSCQGGGDGAQLGYLALPVAVEAPVVASHRRCPGQAIWNLMQDAVLQIVSGLLPVGVRMLASLVESTSRAVPAMAALALRNLAAAGLAHNQLEAAGRWVKEGLSRYPDYGELRLMAAAHAWLIGDAGGCMEQIDLLMAPPTKDGTGWVSGGGEHTYRALSIRGRCWLGLGNEKQAVADLVAALTACPEYLPALRALAGRRLHRDLVERLGLDRHARGRSQVVRDLVSRLYHRSTPTIRTKGASSGPPGLGWEGPFFVHSSLARVNRELLSRLVEMGWDAGIWPTEPEEYDPTAEVRWRTLAGTRWVWPAHCSVMVHHCFPPVFHTRGAARHVVYLPWEFGAPPLEWAEALRQADEVWVYSRHVRHGLITAGLSPKRVHVVPCGVDPSLFKPIKVSEAPGDSPFQFLYVGGSIPRKGYDLAIKAFMAAFSASEPVTLTIKDFGSGSFYRNSSEIRQVLSIAAATAADRRRVLVDSRLLTDEALARLYATADCLVAPYRAEGFCLPVLEAMAAGTPAIVPDKGPVMDFCTPETALLVTSRQIVLGDRLGGALLTGPATVLEVSLLHLQEQMRWAYTHRESLQEMGRKAAAAAGRFTWRQAAEIAHGRLRRLAES